MSPTVFVSLQAALWLLLFDFERFLMQHHTPQALPPSPEFLLRPPTHQTCQHLRLLLELNQPSSCRSQQKLSVKASAALAPATADQLQSPVQAAVLSPPPSPSSLSQEKTTNGNLCELGDTNISSSINVGPIFDGIATTTVPQKRIEVCMGKKCKKSGAPALLQEFEKVVGAKGAVVGCKCMGKCKTGPNVRVQNSVGEDLTEGLNNDSVMIPANSGGCGCYRGQAPRGESERSRLWCCC